MNLAVRPLALLALLAALPLAATARAAEPASRPATKPADKAKPAEKAGIEAPAAKGANPVVIMSTSLGDVKIQLFQDKAPISVANFLAYVDEKYFDGTIFHRTIDNFMIQGGGFDTSRKQKPTKAPIKNEATNGLKNTRGTLAMARTGVVDSATAQFFINVKDNAFLDHRDETPQGFGYAVFGEVIGGQDVVDKIKGAKVKEAGSDALSEAEPIELVIIKSMRRAD